MEKKKYIKPRIEWIPLDNNISLALESNPPAGPDEVSNLSTDMFYNNKTSASS